MTYDPFRLETGLLGNADIEVLDAVFTNRLEAFDPTKLELDLTVQVEGDDGGETIVFLGCGDGWEAADGGQRAVREDGKERGFHQNTKVGEFFAGLVDIMGKDAACDKAMRARVEDYPLGPREVGFWKGLKVHVDREKRKGGGDVGDYEVLVIDGFNGVAGGKAAGAAKKATGAAKKAAAKVEKPSGGLSDAIRATLDEIADASADHDSFMEAAFAQVPEASTDDAVKAAVSDDGEGSIWADAIARYEASQAETGG